MKNKLRVAAYTDAEGGETSMFGWRKRIGYITPTVMEVVAYEFYHFAPEGVGLCAVTCNIEELSATEFKKGLAQVEAAAGYLGSRGVDFIIHGGAPLVASRETGFEAEINRTIAAAGGVPAVTNVTAMQMALELFGIRRIALGSPYPQAQHDRAAAHLAEKGFETVGTKSMNLPFKEMQNTAPSEIYRYCARIAAENPGIEALVLPCPQWQAAQVADVLEKDTGLLVVAATHANFLAAFQAMGLRDPIAGHGRLLASLAAGPFGAN